MTTFVDTSAFYALLDAADANHSKAYRRWRALLADGQGPVMTSNYVAVETCALLANRLGMASVSAFVREVLPAVGVLWIDEKLHFAATEAMLATGARGPGIVDCSSFAAMDAHAIDSAFAFDKHFTARSF
jgi:predicted nucleic acid-binding protein